MRLIAGLLLVAGWLLGAPEARAQTCTANVPELYFGNLQSPVAAAAQVALPLTISCSGGEANSNLRVCVGIDPAGVFSGRAMYLDGNIFASSIDYEIYADPAHSDVWDQNPRREILVPLGAGGSGSATRTLYARMPAAGARPAGAYVSELTDDAITGEIKPGNSGCNSGSSAGSFIGTTFDARVYINGGCNITAGSLLDFGSMMGSTSQQRDGSVQLTATCSPDLPYTIALDAGQVPGNTLADRRLGLDGTGPGAIAYQLYLDSGRSQVWGDGSTGAVHDGTGTGADQDITVYGRVPAGQPLPAAGTYRDMVTATIVY